MTRPNLDDYEPVHDRLARWWTDHPNGRVWTEVTCHTDPDGRPVRYAATAEVYRHADDTDPTATGYADELVGTSPVNRGNAGENAETSALGRALANAGYAGKLRPSREEMRTVTPPTPTGDLPDLFAHLAAAYTAAGLADPDARLHHAAGVLGRPVTSSGDLDRADWERILTDLTTSSPEEPR